MVGRMTQMTHCCWPLTSFSPRFCRHALVVFFLLALMLFYVSTTAGGPTPAFSIGVPTTTTTTGIVKPNDTEPPPEIMLLPSGFDEPRLPNVSETMAKNLTNGSLVVPTPNGPTTTTTGLSLAPSMRKKTFMDFCTFSSNILPNFPTII